MTNDPDILQDGEEGIPDKGTDPCTTHEDFRVVTLWNGTPQFVVCNTCGKAWVVKDSE